MLRPKGWQPRALVCLNRVPDSESGTCDKPAKLPCDKCYIIPYCSKKCRDDSQELHAREKCARNIKTSLDHDGYTDPTPPLWAESQATDVLNLVKHEGKAYDDGLSLLFLGDFGLRHLIYSTVSMPPTAKPKITSLIVEGETFHLYRTIIGLFLLLDQDHDPVLNSEATIQLWYSLSIEDVIWNHIVRVAGSRLLEGDEVMRRWKEDDEEPWETTLFLGKSMVRCRMSRRHWRDLYKLIRNRKPVAPEKVVLSHMMASQIKPLWRRRVMNNYRLMTWVQRGLLGGFVPHGQTITSSNSSSEYGMINPFVLDEDGEYHHGFAAEPLAEWPMQFLERDFLTHNDVYGKMFFRIRDVLDKFQLVLREQGMTFMVRHYDFKGLDRYRLSDFDVGPFDRVVVGPDIHGAYPERTMVATSRLLKHREENPSATMILMVPGTVPRWSRVITDEWTIGEKRYAFEPFDYVLDTLAPFLARDACESGNEYLKPLARRLAGLSYWRDWDKLSNDTLANRELYGYYCARVVPGPHDHRSIFEQGHFEALTMKKNNTITKRWPHRLVRSAGAKPSLREFEAYLGWPQQDPIRYIEFERTGDLLVMDARKWSMDLAQPTDFIVQRVRRCPEVCQFLDAGNRGADISWSSDSVDRDRGAKAAKDGKKRGKGKKQKGKKKKKGKR